MGTVTKVTDRRPTTLDQAARLLNTSHALAVAMAEVHRVLPPIGTTDPAEVLYVNEHGIPCRAMCAMDGSVTVEAGW